MTTTQTQRQVCHTETAGSRISTIPPGLRFPFETAVFGGPLAGQGEYYSTEEEALAGHGKWVERVSEVADNETDYARRVNAEHNKREAMAAARKAWENFELWETPDLRDELIAALQAVPDVETT